MSLASETRRAAENHPFLITALRAGVINYTAGARFLDVDGETDAVATALRRYAEELPEYEPPAGNVRVTMTSGIGPLEDPADAEADGGDRTLAVGGSAFGPGDEGYTAIVASGAVDASSLSSGLAALDLAGIDVAGAGFDGEELLVVVERLDGANAVRIIERVLGAGSGA